jgi:hypothetical protein
MRFSKAQVMEEFERQDRSYRLAILATHWLQGGTQFTPSAIDEARGLQMKMTDRWISYSDLADLLDQIPARFAITTDFALNQLHALLRAPFELLTDYCADVSRAEPEWQLLRQLKSTDWYEFARIIRNTISHNFRFHFTERDKARLPISWRGISLTADLQGKPLTYESFWHNSGYELFLAMRDFAEELPEIEARPASNQ